MSTTSDQPVGTLLRVTRTFAAQTLVALVRLAVLLVTRALGSAEHWLTSRKHAAYGLAVTRILLGLTAVGLLLSNYRSRLYVFGRGSAWNGEAAHPISDFPRIGIFSPFHRLSLHDGGLTAAYLVLLGLAALVVLGWRTRLVLPVFFVSWVSFIEMNDSLGDQGDNMYRIVLLSLLFADPSQRWSWDARQRVAEDKVGHPWLIRVWRGAPILPSWLTTITHNLVLVSVTCQVCFVYASGALYKAGGQPWQNGYAIYNPLHTQRFGPWPELSNLLSTWGPMVTAASWGSIILQMSFPMMLLNRVTRVLALVGMLGFHIGIAVMMGLPWFSLAMVAIDSIFIRDLTWRALAAYLAGTWAAARIRSTTGLVAVDPPLSDPPSVPRPGPPGWTEELTPAGSGSP